MSPFKLQLTVHLFPREHPLLRGVPEGTGVHLCEPTSWHKVWPFRTTQPTLARQ